MKLHDAAIVFAKKRLVHTDEFVDYNKDMYAAFIAGSRFIEYGPTTQLPGINTAEVIPSNPQIIKENFDESASSELTQLKAENEKLLRLLEDVHRKQYELDAIIANWSPNQLKQMQDKEWQQFKEANKI